MRGVGGITSVADGMQVPVEPFDFQTELLFGNIKLVFKRICIFGGFFGGEGAFARRFISLLVFVHSAHSNTEPQLSVRKWAEGASNTCRSHSSVITNLFQAC